MSAIPESRRPLVSFNASLVAYAHSILAYSAFISALVIGSYLHYEKIVKNGFYGYPDEWFPSVSAAIGDRYPERSVFQINIALTSGPRFLLIILSYIRLYKPNSYYTKALLISGIVRTFTCGGWVYITSTDDHDAHDVFMISYIVLTIPWNLAVTKLSPPRSNIRFYRSLTSFTFFGLLFPLVYWFIQHKVHRRAGAYSIYAYFEWSLILLDIGFDTWSIIDLKDLTISLTSSSIEFKKSIKAAEPKSIPIIKESDENSYFSFIVNIINSFIFWSILTSLYLCVWYFPLWYMGISGYEAVIVSLWSPVILSIPFIRNFLSRFPFITRILAVLLGIGSYKIENPESRLLCVGAGAAFSSISLISEIWTNTNSNSPDKNLKSYTVTFMLGLLLSSIIKFLFCTNNPIWPIMHESNGGWNNTGIFVGLIGAIFTPKITTILPSKIKTKGNGGSLILSSLGFGGFLFSLQAMLTDSATIITWTWDGFPINGPTPVPYSMLTFLAMVIGIFLSVKSPNVVSSWKFYSLGLIGSAVLYFYKEWTGYAGGFMYAVYLSAIPYTIFKSCAIYNPGFVFGLGFVFNIFISLGHVWIVAYAFVPGGPLLRERTDIILFGSMFMIACGVFNYKLTTAGDLNSKTISDKDVKSLSKKTIVIISVLLSLAVSATFKRYPSETFKPYNESSRSFTTGIWCIHFGLDNDMWASEMRMRDLIRDAQVDIIGLLESDTQRLIGGNRDITQQIADDLGMYVDYGPGPNKHTWGSALLSKFPIINSTHYLLPSPVGELAPAIHATLEIYGELVDIVVFHSGQEEDEEDRRLQSLKLANIMGESTKPLVLLSYLVTTPLEGNYNTYVSDTSRMFDIDSTDWDRWCEYILFRDLKKVGYARISRSTITDTELQIAKFKLLNNDEIASLQTDDELKDKIYGNRFISEDNVDDDLKFPFMFYGDGVRDHRYHVFDEPRYFEQ